MTPRSCGIFGGTLTLSESILQDGLFEMAASSQGGTALFTGGADQAFPDHTLQHNEPANNIQVSVFCILSSP
jgi:hypothetical protein